MKESAELDRLTKLSYKVTVSERDDIFYIYVSELSLLVCDANLQQAYEMMSKEKTDYFSRMIAMEIADQVPLPHPDRRENELVTGLLEFGLKSAIVGVIALCLTLASVPFLDAFVVKRLGSAPRAAISIFDKQLDRAFGRLEIMSPEAKDALLEALRARVVELRPFFVEVQELWKETPDSTENSL